MIFGIIMSIEDPDEREFVARLYHEHKNKMFQTAKAILHNESLAEEAVHDAFIKIINYVKKFYALNCKETRDLIVIIIRRVSFNIARRNKLIEFTELTENLEADDESSPEVLVISDDTVQHIFKLSASLGSDYGDIFKLRLAFNYSAEEIGKMLDISTENVWVKFHRGKKRLLKMLAEEGIENVLP